MNSKDNNSLWEAGLRRELAVEERARLQALVKDHGAPNLDDDLNLNAILRRLPNHPVPTNFTQCVLDSIARESVIAKRGRSDWRRWFLGGWLPKPALAPVVLGVLLYSYFAYQSHARLQIAQCVAQVSQAAAWMNMDAWQDFDAINRLGEESVPVDEVLLAALQ